MPVVELLRGLAGAIDGLLLTLLLLLLLSETRERFGHLQTGVYYTSLKGRVAWFDPVWVPLISYGTINAILGYVLAVRLTTRRAAVFALAGAGVALVATLLMSSPLPKPKRVRRSKPAK